MTSQIEEFLEQVGNDLARRSNGGTERQIMQAVVLDENPRLELRRYSIVGLDPEGRVENDPVRFTLQVDGDEWVVAIFNDYLFDDVDPDGWWSYSGLKAPGFLGPQHLIPVPGVVAEYLTGLLLRV